MSCSDGEARGVGDSEARGVLGLGPRSEPGEHAAYEVPAWNPKAAARLGKGAGGGRRRRDWGGGRPAAVRLGEAGGGQVGRGERASALREIDEKTGDFH